LKKRLILKKGLVDEKLIHDHQASGETESGSAAEQPDKG
jgi:hypothetical protein